MDHTRLDVDKQPSRWSLRYLIMKPWASFVECWSSDRYSTAVEHLFVISPTTAIPIRVCLRPFPWTLHSWTLSVVVHIACAIPYLYLRPDGEIISLHPDPRRLNQNDNTKLICIHISQSSSFEFILVFFRCLTTASRRRDFSRMQSVTVSHIILLFDIFFILSAEHRQNLIVHAQRVRLAFFHYVMFDTDTPWKSTVRCCGLYFSLKSFLQSTPTFVSC